MGFIGGKSENMTIESGYSPSICVLTPCGHATRRSFFLGSAIRHHKRGYMDPKFIIFAGHKEASSAISMKYCFRRTTRFFSLLRPLLRRCIIICDHWLIWPICEYFLNIYIIISLIFLHKFDILVLLAKNYVYYRVFLFHFFINCLIILFVQNLCL